MAWTAPATYSVAEIVTAAKMNTHVRDNLKYLKGQAGAVALEDALGITVNVNAASGVTITNSNAGISTFASLYLVNDGASIGGLIRNSVANTTYGGANALNLLTFSAHPLALGTNNAVRQLIDSAGNIGFGTLAPQTRLDVAQSSGHMGFWSNNAITSTQAILSGVTRGVVGYHLAGSNDGLLTSSGTPAWSPLALGGTVDLINSGGVDILRVSLSAGGALSIARAAGSKTYTAAFMLVWY